MPPDLFIGRKRELEGLKSLLTKKSASLVVIRGLAVLAKVALLMSLLKACLYFAFTGLPPEKNTTANSQRKEFVRQLHSIWVIWTEDG